MRNMLGILVTMIVALVLCAQTVKAVEITNNEQKIMDGLKQEVKVSGVAFTFHTDDITQLESYLRRTDLSDQAVNQCITNLEAVYNIITKQNIDVSDLHNGDDIRAVVAKMPINVKQETVGYYTKALQAIGLNTASSTSGVIADEDANQIVHGFSSETRVQNSSVVSKLVTDYTNNILLFISLLTGSVLAVVVGRKFSEARSVKQLE